MSCRTCLRETERHAPCVPSQLGTWSIRMDEKRPPEGLSLTAAYLFDDGDLSDPDALMRVAKDRASFLERRERERSGHKLEVVRSVVAHRTGVPASKLRSLRKNRLKE